VGVFAVAAMRRTVMGWSRVSWPPVQVPVRLPGKKDGKIMRALLSPFVPFVPSVPLVPGTPGIPCGPVSPFGPGKPCEPVAPAGPCAPGAPACARSAQAALRSGVAPFAEIAAMAKYVEPPNVATSNGL
jgi:hypothetical protein